MNKIVGIDKKDVFNANGATKLKTAAEQGIEGTLNGFAIQEKPVKRADGTEDTKDVTVLKVDGVLYAGESSTVRDDILRLYEMFQTEIEAGELRIRFYVGHGKRDFVKIEVI